jgi:hypothetical protein
MTEEVVEREAWEDLLYMTDEPQRDRNPLTGLQPT